MAEQVSRNTRKEFEKQWARFLTARDDAKVLKDLDKLLRRDASFDAGWVLEGYIDLYSNRDASAEDKFRRAQMANPQNRIALYYLAELAFARGDYPAAAGFYGDLSGMQASDPQIETKRQKALLLATGDLIRAAARAENENRLGEAEDSYRKALKIAPNEYTLHLRLAELLGKENRLDEAEVERRAARSLNPAAGANADAADARAADDLESVGRWGSNLDLFHEIRGADAINRGQLAALIVAYFPQIADFSTQPPILTDADSSPLRNQIQTVAGAGVLEPLPNHAFQPSAIVTRGVLAGALVRLCRRLGVPVNGFAGSVPADVAPSSALYADIQLALGAELIDVRDTGLFDASGPASGAQAVGAMERLLHIFQQDPH